MDCWSEIRKLKGKTLKTLDRGNPFDVVDVTEDTVIVSPSVTGNERIVDRERVEGSFRELVGRGEISLMDVRTRHSDLNPTYIVAMLAALPGVKHTVRPIRLQYRLEKRENEK